MLNALFSRKTKPSYSKEVIDIMRLMRSENIGNRTFNELIRLFGNATDAIENVAELSLKGGRKKPLKVCSEAVVQKELAQLYKIGAGIVSYKDMQYSELLTHIPDFPPILTYKGNIEHLNSDRIIGIVGARNSSIYGRSFASKIANDLLAHDYLTASGLAKGIDTVVHSACPERTIAVIAGGIDNIYPAENEKLYHKIAEKGLILSEQPLGARPHSSFFPMRNRIISGISISVAVVEASLKSGSLITANLALEQNRDVFAVPGFPLDPRSGGGNKLIKDGAFLLESAQDIMDNVIDYAKLHKSLKEQADNDNSFRPLLENVEVKIDEQDRNKVINLMSSMPVSYEAIAKETGFMLPKIYTICLELELASRLIRHPGNKVSIKF